MPHYLHTVESHKVKWMIRHAVDEFYLHTVHTVDCMTVCTVCVQPYENNVENSCPYYFHTVGLMQQCHTRISRTG